MFFFSGKQQTERSSMATCFGADDTMKGLSDLFGFELGVVRSFLIWMVGKELGKVFKMVTR